VHEAHRATRLDEEEKSWCRRVLQFLQERQPGLGGVVGVNAEEQAARLVSWIVKT